MSNTNYNNRNTSEAKSKHIEEMVKGFADEIRFQLQDLEELKGCLKTSIKRLNKLLREMDNVIDIWANTRTEDIAQVVDSTTKSMPIEEVDV